MNFPNDLEIADSELLSQTVALLQSSTAEDFYTQLEKVFLQQFQVKLKGIEFQNPQTTLRIKKSRKVLVVSGALPELDNVDCWQIITIRNEGKIEFFRCGTGVRIFLSCGLKRLRHLGAKEDLQLKLLAGIVRQFFSGYYLQQNSIRDDLTRAYNQNYLKQIINHEIERNRRSFLPFAIIFLDVDNLKELNERHSHLIGSALLKELAELLLKNFRKSDVVARFGGDEFVIVLFNALEMQALKACQRLQRVINSYLFCQQENLQILITASYGIAVFDQSFQSAEEIIRAADLAMFQVKKNRGNGINFYRGEK